MPDTYDFELPLDRNPPRAFVSYSTHDKSIAGQCKAIIENIGIEAFTAHDDIDISDEWKRCILAELNRADIFVAVLSKHFKASDWAPQEIGFACCRDLYVVPISLDDTVSFGFIGHVQSRRLRNDEDLERLLADPIARRFPRTCVPQLIHHLKDAQDFRGAERLMQPLLTLFDLFTPEEAQAFAVASTNNGQIWDASLCCSEYIPAFLKTCDEAISKEVGKALRFQITHNKWFDPEASVGIAALAEQLGVPADQLLDVARTSLGLEVDAGDKIDRKTAIAIKGLLRER